MKILELFSGEEIYTYESEDFISNSIYKHKCWEPNVTDTIINILKKYETPVFFDIGCNFGYFSILSSKHCGKIYSFDSNKNNIDLLNLSIEKNGIKNIQTYHNCVSDDILKFYKMNIDDFTNVGALKVEECGEIESNIKTIVLDDFIKNNKINNIDLIKIDVEGAEYNCLKGLKTSFDNGVVKNIIIEITPLWSVDESEKILNFLKDYFDLYNIGLIEDSEYGLFYENIKNSKINGLNDIDTEYERNVQTNILGVKKI
jgi:FkbM family methyltransferase